MIERYSLKEMSQIWTLESRFSKMLQVEKAVAQVQGDMRLIPKKAAKAIVEKGRFTLKGIQKEELKTKHDVTAFVNEVTRYLEPSEGGYIHYGLTSSDVLDTAFSLQLKDSQDILQKSFSKVKKQFQKLIVSHKGTICCGRTHGIHAEPLTFGFKLLGHLMAIQRAESTFNQSLKEALIGKFSGAVGAYSALSPEVEKRVCKKLNLKPEPVATQVVPRDRHARVIFSLGLIGASVERLAIEIRHLQRTEVAEVAEGFTPGQTGSSAMPHKQNPISSENLTGLARLLRSYIAPALENISLWHERDISHSSVERVLFPDAFTLTHFLLNRMEGILKHLKINKEQMKKNLELSRDRIFSSRVLNALVSKGISRKEAYKKTQALSLNLKEGESLSHQAKKHFKGVFTNKELTNIFSDKHLTALTKRTENILKEISQ